MFCKRCGSALPSTGFLCTNCGFMMDAEQIKVQKEQMIKNPINQRTQMVGMHFGHKEQIFQKREKVSQNYLGIFLFIAFVLLFILLVLLFVYFL